MAILCDCCINAVKSRGEHIFVGGLVRDEDFKLCTWCEEEKEELYEVEFERHRHEGYSLDDMER